MNKIDWRGLGRAYLFFWFFSLVCHVLLLATGATGHVPLRQGIIFSFLWLIPLLAFPKQTRPIAAVIGIVLWVFSLLNLGYFAIYGQEFSQSVLFIVFESNPAEASEYVDQYFVWWMIPAALLYSTVAFWLWRRIRPLDMQASGRWVMIVLIVISLLTPPVLKASAKSGFNTEDFVTLLANRMEPAVPWQFGMGYLKYQMQLKNIQSIVSQSQRIPPIAQLVDAHAGEARTLVLVIGESTNSQHMSLYGYARKTTPKLDSLGDQLTVFKQAFASRPYTIEVLQQVLTFADQENPDLHLTKPSLMQIMKQAGYKTYWITNQQTLTKRNTLLTSFSEQMDEQVYLNHTRAQNSYQLDGNVLEPFQRILNDGAERRFIVVHLLGTHLRYKFRYPRESEVFKGRENLPDWVNESQLTTINEYDNAVLYNDLVVSSLIEKLSRTGGKSMMTYLSDHGENVYDWPPHDFLGRNEARPSPPMYSIPFIVWHSNGWKAADPRRLDQHSNRPYQLSHFIHTWADLTGLRFEGFDASKSVVNKDFKERPILVGDPSNLKGFIDLRKMLEKTPGK